MNNVIDKLVLVFHHIDDLSWLNELKYPFIVISSNGSEEKTPENLGGQEYKMFDWIVRNYDRIPTWLFSIHGHKYSYHHSGSLSSLVNSQLFDRKYRNINNRLILSKEDVRRDLHDNGFVEIVDEHLPEFLSILNMDPSITFDQIQSKHSSQFYVHNSLIYQYSVDQWKQLMELHDKIRDSHEPLLFSQTTSLRIASAFFEVLLNLMFTRTLMEEY